MGLNYEYTWNVTLLKLYKFVFQWAVFVTVKFAKLCYLIYLDTGYEFAYYILKLNINCISKIIALTPDQQTIS